MDWKTESQLRSELSEVWKLLDAERLHTRFVAKQRDEWKATAEAHKENFDLLAGHLRKQRDELLLALETIYGLGLLALHNGKPHWVLPITAKDRADAAIASVKGDRNAP
jgi:hypothetical protein